MSDSRPDDTSIAPRRSLAGAGSGSTGDDRPILPPPPEVATPQPTARQVQREAAKKARADRAASQAAKKQAERLAQKQAKEQAKRQDQQEAQQQARSEAEARAQETTAQPVAAPVVAATAAAAARPTQRTGSSRSGSSRPAAVRRPPRRARLRVVQVDAWSVMKTAFLLSIALGIVLVVAVGIVWSVLSAAGVWDSINSVVNTALGTTSNFEVQTYVGTSRVLGLSMILAVVDVVLITAIATLGAFLYNLAATLIGGIEVTFAEDQ